MDFSRLVNKQKIIILLITTALLGDFLLYPALSATSSWCFSEREVVMELPGAQPTGGIALQSCV